MYFHFFSKQTTQKSNQIEQTTYTLTQKNIPTRELMKNFNQKENKRFKKEEKKAKTMEAWSDSEKRRECVTERRERHGTQRRKERLSGN